MKLISDLLRCQLTFAIKGLGGAGSRERLLWQPFRATSLAAARACSGKTGVRALADEILFELGVALFRRSDCIVLTYT